MPLLRRQSTSAKLWPWLLAFGLFWLSGSLAQAASPSPWSGKVVKVDNGSSLEIQHGGQIERLNLAGAMAPDENQPWGDPAKRFTTEAAQGQVVTVELQGQDHKKRSTATVILPDGRDLGAELIKEGLAWHHRKSSKNPMLADLEKDARAERRGLWSDPKPVPPWEWGGRNPSSDSAEDEQPKRKSNKKRR